MDKNDSLYEDVTPNPEFLIKSIAEQGYSLESALADLMDNSLSANASRIEVLADAEKQPFTLFLADNGDGMSLAQLKSAMQFPSSSPEDSRSNNDLGRFGLGLKTASFSQTRSFTVLSRQKGESLYNARTWDVSLLKSGKWRMLINNADEINELLLQYNCISKEHLNESAKFSANTIVIWKGLYKFENYIDENNRIAALKKELTEVTAEYLEIVFHRFMEREANPLILRINNKILSPFNPFPISQSNFRSLEPLKKKFHDDAIKIEGFVLPSRSIDESSDGLNIWTTRYRSLMGMEGIYIYRCNRIIFFGGWNRLIKKGPRLQLARLRVDIGNGVDNLINLNVAKSQVIIPHDLKRGFEEYIIKLKVEAEKEFYNRGLDRFPSPSKPKVEGLFSKKSSNKGVLLEFNDDFPLIKDLKLGLDKDDKSKFLVLLKMINTQVNKIRHVHQTQEFVGLEEHDGVSLEHIATCIKSMKNLGIKNTVIKERIVEELGFGEGSLPESILKTLEN